MKKKKKDYFQVSLGTGFAALPPLSQIQVWGRGILIGLAAHNVTLKATPPSYISLRENAGCLLVNTAQCPRVVEDSFFECSRNTYWQNTPQH